MPSLGSGEATAVASTTDSPWVTSAAPDACLAIRPVSKLSRLPPASSTVTSCFINPLFLITTGDCAPHCGQSAGRPSPLHAAQRHDARPDSDLRGESRVGKFLGGKDGGNPLLPNRKPDRVLLRSEAHRWVPRKAFASQRGSPAPAMRAIRAVQFRQRIHLGPLPSPRIPS